MSFGQDKERKEGRIKEQERRQSFNYDQSQNIKMLFIRERLFFSNYLDNRYFEFIKFAQKRNKAKVAKAHKQMEEETGRILDAQRTLLKTLNTYPWKQQENNNEFHDLGFEAFLEKVNGQTQTNNGWNYYVVFQSQQCYGIFPFIQAVIINEILELLAQSASEQSQHSAFISEINNLGYERSTKGKNYTLVRCTRLRNYSNLIKYISDNFYWFEGAFMPKAATHKEEELKIIEYNLTQKWLMYQQSILQRDVFEWTYCASLRENTPFILVQTSGSIQPSQIRQFILFRQAEQITGMVVPPMSLKDNSTKEQSESSIYPMNQESDSKHFDLENQEKVKSYQQYEKASITTNTGYSSHLYGSYEAKQDCYNSHTQYQQINSWSTDQNNNQTMKETRVNNDYSDNQSWQQKFRENQFQGGTESIQTYPQIGSSNLSYNQQDCDNVDNNYQRELIHNNIQLGNLSSDEFETLNKNFNQFSLSQKDYCQNRNIIEGVVKKQKQDIAQKEQGEGGFENGSGKYKVEQYETDNTQGRKNERQQEGKAQNELRNYSEQKETEEIINSTHKEKAQDNERNMITIQNQDANQRIQELETINDQQKKYLEYQELEWSKVMFERQEEVNSLKNQLNDFQEKNKEEVKKLKKKIKIWSLKLRRKKYYYSQQKEKFALKDRKLDQSQENLQTQKLKINKIEEIAQNSINELNLMKEEKRKMEERLQDAIQRENKLKNLWENKQKEHEKKNLDKKGTIAQLQQENTNLKYELETIKQQAAQSQNDFELALIQKQSIYSLLENKNQQTLEAIASLKEELNDSKSVIVSYQQEAKKLQDKFDSSSKIQLDLQEQLKDKTNQISNLNYTMNNQYKEWEQNMKETISKKDQEIQSIKNKAFQESKLAAANAKDLLILKQQYQEQTGKLIDITRQLNQYKFDAKEAVLASQREAIRTCSECNQPVPSVGQFNGKDLCLSCYQDYLSEFY